MALRRLHISANDSPLIQSNPIQYHIKLSVHQVLVFIEIYTKTLLISSKAPCIIP